MQRNIWKGCALAASPGLGKSQTGVMAGIFHTF